MEEGLEGCRMVGPLLPYSRFIIEQSNRSQARDENAQKT
jgi:hypothetical protein